MSEISRRNLVAAAAWSVPLISVLSATPALAGSPVECTTDPNWSTGSFSSRPFGQYTNNSGSTLALTLTELYPSPALTLGVESEGNSVFFTPSIGLSGANFSSGATASYAAVPNPVNSGTYVISLPPGVSIRFYAAGRTGTGCQVGSSVTVMLDGCPLTYQMECYPF